MDIESSIREIRKRIDRACERSHRSANEIKVVAVTKGVGVPTIRSAFECGIRDFGENRVQEAEDKISQLQDLKPDVTWHMVGHLQSNKARTALGLFDIIHSVDSVRLAQLLDQWADRVIPVLLQVNISEESTKSGFDARQIGEAVDEIRRLSHLEVIGLMTIAPVTTDPEEVRPVFRKLRHLRESLKLEHLSMGMTDDFEVAIEEGATMLRIGRAIFGDRR